MTFGAARAARTWPGLLQRHQPLGRGLCARKLALKVLMQLLLLHVIIMMQCGLLQVLQHTLLQLAWRTHGRQFERRCWEGLPLPASAV